MSLSGIPSAFRCLFSDISSSFVFCLNQDLDQAYTLELDDSLGVLLQCTG